mmetsp:Transcript_17279/g.26178  ORF Transcript_17279/g.26178 Transcript_17279/m.26178 type:complete len:218 (+) Transcript_17279:159-812(+)
MSHALERWIGEVGSIVFPQLNHLEKQIFAGLNLPEGYGMTENFGYSHMSREGRSRVGFVGEPYSEVRHRISSDGEIQELSPAVMMGCLKNANATSEALTLDGWLRTGDQGVLDHMGRLKITGHTKELFKTSKGKYVAPAPIENLFLSHHKVELSCLSGRAHPQPYCIIQTLRGSQEDGIKKFERTEQNWKRASRAHENYQLQTRKTRKSPIPGYCQG